MNVHFFKSSAWLDEVFMGNRKSWPDHFSTYVILYFKIFLALKQTNKHIVVCFPACLFVYLFPSTSVRIIIIIIIGVGL